MPSAGCSLARRCRLETRRALPPHHPQGEADATWVFMGWEGVEAKRKGVELNAFK